jgi:hypothetical protein
VLKGTTGRQSGAGKVEGPLEGGQLFCIMYIWREEARTFHDLVSIARNKETVQEKEDVLVHAAVTNTTGWTIYK